MNKVVYALLFLASSMANAKIDLIINLQVDQEVFVRRISTTDEVMNKNCEEGNLKVEVMAKKVDTQIEIDFVISKKDKTGFFTLVSKPHMVVDPGTPASIELKEEAPQERFPGLKQVCNLLGVQPRMVVKSALKLVVIASR
jgi:hypothetical protein